MLAFLERGGVYAVAHVRGGGEYGEDWHLAGTKLKKQNDKTEADQVRSFTAFLSACAYLDEVLEIISLPEDIRERLGHRSTGLVAVTPETVAALKKTFKQAA